MLESLAAMELQVAPENRVLRVTLVTTVLQVFQADRALLDKRDLSVHLENPDRTDEPEHRVLQDHLDKLDLQVRPDKI